MGEVIGENMIRNSRLLLDSVLLSGIIRDIIDSR